MSVQVSSNNQALSTARPSMSGQHIAAMAFGLMVLFAVGFAPMNVAHNAAHDVRHAYAFPCH